jgi:hypothetical protein
VNEEERAIEDVKKAINRLIQQTEEIKRLKSCFVFKWRMNKRLHALHRILNSLN